MALKIFQALYDALIPPICEGCNSLLKSEEKRFCSTCLLDLDPLGDEESVVSDPLFDCLSAVWLYQGAAKRLLNRFKEERRELDIPLFVSFLLIQLEKQPIPFPHLIVSVPQDPLKRWVRGFDPIGSIAKELSKQLEIPRFLNVKRLPGRPSQMSLSRNDRLMLDEKTFYLTDSKLLRGQRVLLLDDIYTTGSTLKSVARTLWQGHPLALYGLTLAKVPGPFWLQ